MELLRRSLIGINGVGFLACVYVAILGYQLSVAVAVALAFQVAVTVAHLVYLFKSTTVTVTKKVAPLKIVTSSSKRKAK